MASLKRILLTTSRNPTPRIRTFCNDLERVMLGVVHVNRGKMSNDEVAEKALEHNSDRIVIVDRRHGGLGAVRFFKVSESGLVSVPPVIQVGNMQLQREFSVSTRIKPAGSLILLKADASGEVERVAGALSNFFGLPILSMDEAVKAGLTIMSMGRDGAGRIMITFMVKPQHVEVGPRVIASKVEW